MLTFEKVLEVFADYLELDADYEVILTKHGYTVMGFDSSDNDWSDIKSEKNVGMFARGKREH